MWIFVALLPRAAGGVAAVAVTDIARGEAATAGATLTAMAVGLVAIATPDAVTGVPPELAETDVEWLEDGEVETETSVELAIAACGATEVAGAAVPRERARWGAKTPTAIAALGALEMAMPRAG